MFRFSAAFSSVICHFLPAATSRFGGEDRLLPAMFETVETDTPTQAEPRIGRRYRLQGTLSVFRHDCRAYCTDHGAASHP
jgi:hypothetical protein